MICPICNSDNTQYISGYQTEKGNYRRYRQCNVCQHKFFTIEYYVESMPHKEHKTNLLKDNKRVTYYIDCHGLLRVKELRE